MAGTASGSGGHGRGATALVAVAASLALHLIAARGGDALPPRVVWREPQAIEPSDGEVSIESVPIPALVLPDEPPAKEPPLEAASVAPERPTREAAAPTRDPMSPEPPPPAQEPDETPETPSTTPDAPSAPPLGPPASPEVAEPPGAALPAPGAPDEYGLPPAAEGSEGAGLPGLPGVPGLPGGSTPIWALPGAVAAPESLPAPTRAPAAAFDPKAATKALGGTLQASDKEKGVNLPAAGTVVSALATSVQGTPAPHNARATFEIKLGPDGRVTGARVVKASAGDPAMWDAALKRAQAQIAAKGLAMTGEAAKSGATVRVSVLTRHVFPTGTGKKLELRPQCANGVLNEVIVAARKKSEQGEDDPNGIPAEVAGANPFVDANGLPCIPMGIDGTLDPSNIGAHRQLQVQTQFAVELADARSLPTSIEKVDTSAPWVPNGGAPRPNNPYAVRKREQKRQKKK